MRKVLVTGGAGFVGRRLVKRLLEAGDEVHCVDSLAPLSGAIEPGSRWFRIDPTHFENFHFYHEDCRQYFDRVKATDFDLCFHLAAIVGGRLVIEQNPLAVADDLSIDAAYWRWAVETKPKRSVCFSSSAAYPVKFQRRDDFKLLSEEMIDFKDDLGVPDMSYGWSKLTLEYLGRLAWEKHGLKSIVYRPFSGYGEDQDLTYPAPSICKRVLDNTGATELTVWGSGEQQRDFIYIEDCIDGILATLDKIDDGDAINLSTGVYTDFKTFARTAAWQCGYAPNVVGTTDNPEGVFARAGDTVKQRSLGFTYSTTLESGIEKMLNYFSN
ncbi:MAG: NAD(P)-dependent oxidoreductase [Acidobacteria bacterium]|nr:NAD(P)-dependent oxidoreductase [Acidobacteriota bacterium]